MERWRKIKGFEGFYEVSSLGRVRTVKRMVKNGLTLRTVPQKVLSPGVNEYGYRYVILFKNNIGKPKRVNRLVATAFKRNPLNKSQVNHIDGDRLNDRVDNLEWATPKENMQDAFRRRRNGKQLKLSLT